MPIYEYSCGACEHQLEALQKVSEEPLKYCPECGEEELKRLISSVGFRLKGTGWYETDFKNQGSKDKKNGTSSEDGKSTTAKKESTGSSGDSSSKSST